MRNVKIGLLVFISFTIITGVVYPMAITLLAQLLFPHQANGSLAIMKGAVRGSKLIGQKFRSPAYFWPRPSSCDYNPMPSGASNLSPDSASLQQTVQQRQNELAPHFQEPIPADLLLASGSGLDPHISPASAYAQIDHVATARNLDEEQRRRLTALVQKQVEYPQWGILGSASLNVLKINILLDETFGAPPARTER